MKGKLQLRKPEHWQDFESLCKKLWGEIWKCPEIQKNGRQFQQQHGVDIYGIPFGETQYYGIQCKGKDDYTDSELTESEIEREISKAKLFTPKLKKLYFTTTANKNAEISAYVRQRNIDHITTGLFEIHLFAWEDIVDLIDENKQTHDWYIKSQNFKSSHAIKFVFENDDRELTINVPFARIIKHYKQRIIPSNVNFRFPFPRTPIPNMNFYDTTINKSICRFHFRLHNTGTVPITDYKIFLEFNGEFESIDTCSKNSSMFIKADIKYDTFIWNEDKQGKIIPLNSTLVPDDLTAFDTICLKPIKEERTIIVKWKLVSTDFKDEGELTLKIVPEIISKEETILIEDPLQVRTEESLGDLIEDLKKE